MSGGSVPAGLADAARARLSPGIRAQYTLSFDAPDFQKENVAAFDLAIAQAVTINAVMQVGSVTQAVAVHATTTEVESSTAQLGTVIAQKSVNDLPLDGRNFTQLLDLTPGVTPISTGQNSSASNTAVVASSTTNYSFPSINGAGNRSTMYLLDGMNDNQAWYNTYAVPPIVDTIQEFKINSHNDSEYGGESPCVWLSGSDGHHRIEPTCQSSHSAVVLDCGTIAGC